jgi:uncharacterized protein YeaO (DUF488 family)
MRIHTKRVYEAPAEADGLRVLVDRVWPRGQRKEDIRIDRWLKSIAPSTELRKWFNHEPDKWREFMKRYFEELRRHRDELAALIDSAGERSLTLVYSATDERHNNAEALRQYLLRHQVSSARASRTIRMRRGRPGKQGPDGGQPRNLD